MSDSEKAPSVPPMRPSLSSELDMALGSEDVGSEPMTAFLVGLTGNLAGKLFRIPGGESVVGRSSRAFLSLKEKGVSYQHAKLTLTSNACTISDLDSTNGTRVNDIRVNEPLELHAGDVIRFGHATLGFLTDADDEQQHTRALARATSPHKGLLSKGPSPNGTDPGGLITARSSMPPPVHIPPGGIGLHTGEQGLIQTGPPPMVSMEPASPTEKLDNMLDMLGLGARFLKRYGWLLTFSTLGFATLFAGTVAISPPPATAEFEVFLREKGVETAARNFASQSVGFFEFAEKDFANRNLVEQTLKDVGVPTDPFTIKTSVKSLELKREGLQPYYTGTFTHTDRAFAERFLAAHLKNYLEFKIGSVIAVKFDEVRLLREEYEANRTRLREAEEALRDFRTEHLVPQEAQQRIATRVSLLSRKDMLMAELDRSRRELKLAQEQLKSQSSLAQTVVSKSQPYEAALSAVRTKIASARAQGFADGHPELVKLLDEERELQKLKDSALSSTTSNLERDANPEYVALRRRVGELSVAVSSTQKELGQVDVRLGEISNIASEMPAVEVEIDGLMRDVEVAKRLHDKLYDQLKAKELELDLERTNVRARYEVLSRPHAAAASPVSVAVKRAALGGGLGLVLGLIFAVLHWVVGYARERNQKIVVA